jgi:hypothetical protein
MKKNRFEIKFIPQNDPSKSKIDLLFPRFDKNNLKKRKAKRKKDNE